MRNVQRQASMLLRMDRPKRATINLLAGFMAADPDTDREDMSVIRDWAGGIVGRGAVDPVLRRLVAGREVQL